MSEIKRYGTRLEVYEGTAQSTKSGIVREQLLIHNNKLKTKKEIDIADIRREQLKSPIARKAEAAPVRKVAASAQVPEPQPEEDQSGDEGLAKAIPTPKYKLNELKQLVNAHIAEHKMYLPPGVTKWKKAEWAQFAAKLGI